MILYLFIIGLLIQPQGVASPQLKSTSSPIFLSDSSLIKGKSSVITYTVDLTNERLFLFHDADNHLYEVDFTGKATSSIVSFNESEFEKKKIHYDESENVLMFWDDGVGRVHRLQLDDGSIQRMDRSFNFKAFLLHTAWVTDQQDIYIMGGYGLFQLKNLLLMYSTELKEWIEIPVKGDIPGPGYGQLYFVEPDSSFLYFKFEPDNASKLSWGTTVYSLDTESYYWERIGYFNVEDIGISTGNTMSNRVGNNRIDTQNGILHIADNAFYDIHRKMIFSIDLSLISPELLSIFSMFYTGNEDEWIIFGLNKGQIYRPFIQKIRLSELLESSTIYKMDSGVSSAVYLLGILFLLLLFIFVGVGRLRNNQRTDSAPEPSKTLVSVSLNESEVVLDVQGKRSLVKDPFELKLWSFVAAKLSLGLNSFDVAEFDQQVLGSIQHPSQRSKKRAALLDSVHRMIGEEIFILHQSSVDKRYKEIAILEDRIRVL